MSIPDRIEQQVSCDFIIDLRSSRDPTTGVLYDSICTIVEKLTKYTWFIPWHSSWDSKDFAHTFMRIIFQKIDILEVIISDRDTKFISDF